MPDAERTYFTLAEANATLPLVRRVVRDIVAAAPGLQAGIRELRALSGDDGADPDRVATLRAELEHRSERINGYIAELSEIGCLFKGLELGLVDFFARYRGRDIFLCWQHGEAAVESWHELEGGYAGRQPITPEMAEALDGAPVGD